MKRNIITIILLSLFSFTAIAKTEYKIEIKFIGEIDSLVILANYYGNSFQVVDTLKFENNTTIITVKEPLKQGIYTLAKFDKTKYFDFVIDENPFFKITANSQNPIDSVDIIDSPDNDYFFKYLQLNSKLYQLSQQIQQTKSIPSKNNDLLFEKDFILSELDLLKNEIKKKLPGSVLDLIFTSMEKPKSPADVESDEQKRYQYFKSHYWDLIALDDVRMLRTPVFHRKMEYFFDRIVIQHPDSLAAEIDNLLVKEIDSEIYKYIIWNLTLKYEEPKIMGLDKVFVHLVDHYFEENKLNDISPGIINNFKERADKVRPLLIGETAPNMIMVDTLGNFAALNNHLTNGYTLVLFWDSDCQTCQKEIKELKKLYKKSNYDFEIFAVSTDIDIEIWKKYIRDHDLNWINVNGTKSMTPDFHDLYNIYSTPTIYILDKNKKIIGKNLIVGQLEGFLNHYELMNNKN